MEVLLGLQLAATLFIAYILVDQRERASERTRPSVADVLEQLEPDLSDYEKERQAWQSAFDTRISVMKEELANAQPERQPNGEEAQELHPLVKNLPHTNIYEKSPQIEVAE